MRFYITVLICLLIFVSCGFDNNNPLEIEDALKNPPFITRVEFSNDSGFVVFLNKSYSEEENLMFERKIFDAFEPFTVKSITSSSFADTTLSLELDYNLTYRLRVEKNGYYSEYSNTKEFAYTSSSLNKPSNLSYTVQELQGVRLSWKDNSQKETGYKIEKNSGSGFIEIASLPANSETYIDIITDIPNIALNLQYRVKAFNQTLQSAWLEGIISYSGIAAPTNLTISNTSSSSIQLNWQDNSSIETGYEIERKKDNGNFQSLTVLPANTAQYTDVVSEIGEYHYRVRAVKDNLYSAYSATASQAIESVLPTEGLVAYYPFNGNANDESGNGNHGTVHGATLTEDRFSNPNSAYSFDGNSDYIQTNFEGVLGIQARTICVWFSTNSNSVQNLLYYGSRGLGRNISCAINGWNAINQNGIVFDIGSTAILYEGDVVNNNWIFVVWRIMENSIAKDAEIFLNSNAITNTLYEYYPNRLINTSNDHPLMIGNKAVDNFYFNGYIDDIRIYNRALSEAEIQALYHEGGWESK